MFVRCDWDQTLKPGPAHPRGPQRQSLQALGFREGCPYLPTHSLPLLLPLEERGGVGAEVWKKGDMEATTLQRSSSRLFTFFKARAGKRQRLAHCQVKRSGAFGMPPWVLGAALPYTAVKLHDTEPTLFIQSARARPGKPCSHSLGTTLTMATHATLGRDHSADRDTGVPSVSSRVQNFPMMCCVFPMMCLTNLEVSQSSRSWGV